MSVYRDLAWLFIFSAAAFNASGAPITGFLWNVTDLVAQNAILANVPGTPPNVTFSVNSPLNFDNGGSVNDFLTSGGAFNIVGSVADLSRSISPSLLEFIGMVSVTNGQQFTVTHDDGLTLNIGGLDVITASGQRRRRTQPLPTPDRPAICHSRLCTENAAAAAPFCRSVCRFSRHRARQNREVSA